MFFDDYARFFQTSKVFPNRDRLNLRYEAIFAGNQSVLEGARVLDIASHDGRWSFAALRTGAAHVTGIEARPELVEGARENFAHYGEDPESYTFICGDIFDVLRQQSFDVDVVLCLGYLYHTYRHTELLHHIREIDPTCLIVDTYVVPGVKQPFVKLFLDRPDNQGKAILDPYGHAQRTIVGRPSVPALRTMLATYDFGIEQTYDWDSLLARHPDAKQVNDYRTGWRVTVRGRTGAPTSGAAGGPDGNQRQAGKAQPTSQGTRASAQAPRQAAPARPNNQGSEASSPNGQRWRHWVNRGLAKATGYELRKASRSG